jgi:hypothetical protein
LLAEELAEQQVAAVEVPVEELADIEQIQQKLI